MYEHSIPGFVEFSRKDRLPWRNFFQSTVRWSQSTVGNTNPIASTPAMVATASASIDLGAGACGLSDIHNGQQGWRRANKPEKITTGQCCSHSTGKTASTQTIAETPGAFPHTRQPFQWAAPKGSRIFHAEVSPSDSRPNSPAQVCPKRFTDGQHSSDLSKPRGLQMYSPYSRNPSFTSRTEHYKSRHGSKNQGQLARTNLMSRSNTMNDMMSS